MHKYLLVTSRQSEPLPPKSAFSDFYVLSEDDHNRELTILWIDSSIGQSIVIQ